MALGASKTFQYFLLADPDRVVIDLAVGQDQFPPPSRAVRGGVIRDVRVGRFRTDILRLVLDLRQPAVVRRAEMIDRDQAGAMLVLDLSTSDQAIFLDARKRGEVPGTVVVEAAPAGFSSPPLPMVPPGGGPAALAHPTTAVTSLVPLPRAPPGGTSPNRAGGRNGEGRVPVSTKPVIVIDPGHGGKDPGTAGAGDVQEKTVTLEMGKELARELRATGRYIVRLTRTSDVFVSLPQRVAIADKDHADLFISLHCNWIKNEAIHGLAIYTLSSKASDRETAMLARNENSVDYVNGVDLHERNPDVAKILLSLAQREATNRAVIFSGDVVQALNPKLLLQPDPHRSADFRVLIDPDVPSVLIEMAYLSNPKDEHNLESPIWRAQLGGRLVAAINQYFAAVHD